MNTHFSCSPSVSQSSPPIPLAPGGPLTDRIVTSRPIDDIISDIVASGSKKSDPHSLSKEETWPYISDGDVTLTEWVDCVQPDTVVEVSRTDKYGLIMSTCYGNSKILFYFISGGLLAMD